jgi:hypothetical protein
MEAGMTFQVADHPQDRWDSTAAEYLALAAQHHDAIRKIIRSAIADLGALPITDKEEGYEERCAACGEIIAEDAGSEKAVCSRGHEWCRFPSLACRPKQDADTTSPMFADTPGHRSTTLPSLHDLPRCVAYT